MYPGVYRAAARQKQTNCRRDSSVPLDFSQFGCKPNGDHKGQSIEKIKVRLVGSQISTMTTGTG